MPERLSKEQGRKAVEQWKKYQWPQFKNGLQQRRIVCFVDEAGLGQKQNVVRTWAPKGRTPILECNWNHKGFSLMAAMSLVNFHFKLLPRTGGFADVVGFGGNSENTPSQAFIGVGPLALASQSRSSG